MSVEDGESPAAAPEPADFDVGSAIDDIAGEMGIGEKKPAEGATGEGAEGEEGKAPAAAPAGAEPAPAPPAEGAQPAADAKAPVGDAPPDTWTAAGKAQWATLPDAVKAEVIKREGDIQRGIEQYGQMAKVGEYLAKEIQPFADLYQRNGMPADKMVGPLFNMFANLVWGTPEQKVSMFKSVAEDAGIDLSKLASGDPNAVDPRLTRLQQEVIQLRQGVQNSLGAIHQSRLAETSGKVEAFAADHAKHPYFWDVIDDMKVLVDRGVAQGLDDAYDKAVMNNPLTRAQEIERLATEKAAQKAKEAAEKAVKVKKATAANVRSSEQGGAAPGKLGTIDDTLNEALAGIRARE